jgi:hypothetical protein
MAPAISFSIEQRDGSCQNLPLLNEPYSVLCVRALTS